MRVFVVVVGGGGRVVFGFLLLSSSLLLLLLLLVVVVVCSKHQQRHPSRRDFPRGKLQNGTHRKIKTITNKKYDHPDNYDVFDQPTGHTLVLMGPFIADGERRRPNVSLGERTRTQTSAPPHIRKWCLYHFPLPHAFPLSLPPPHTHRNCFNCHSG